MKLKKRWLLLVLLLIGLTASLEMAPRVFVIRMTVPLTSQCPCNPTPYGTSEFIGYLEERGHRVELLASVEDVRRLNTTGFDVLVYLVIAPTSLGEEQARRIAWTLDNMTSRIPVMVAIFDELPPEGERLLATMIESKACPQLSQLVIASITPDNPEATVHFDNGVSLSTGYTSYIALAGTETPVTVGKDPLRGPLMGYKLHASVWPSPGQYQNLWTPLAVSCRGNNRGVLLVADSSILINLAVNTSLDYAREAARVLEDASGAERMLVVIDTSLYVPPEATVTLRLHPSFLLIKLGEAYASLEARFLGSTVISYLYWLIILLAATLILLATWASSNAAGGLGEEKGRKKRKRRAKEGPRLEIRRPRVGSSCREIVERVRSQNIPGLVRGIANPVLREEAETILGEIESICLPGYLGLILNMLLPSRERRAAEKLALLESMLGLRTTISLGSSGGSREQSLHSK